MLRQALVILVIVVFAEKADACSCFSSGPPCQNFFQVDAVFVGTVQTIAEIESTPDSFQRRRVVFAVERTFRGASGMAAEVVTGMGGGDCGYAFKAGARYLVYASRASRDTLVTGICSRTRPIAEAAEDLRYLESLPPVGTGARVWGTITHWETDLATRQPREYGRVPFVHLTLRGRSGTANTQTDDQGRYEMTGLLPGTYELQATPPAEFSSKYLQATLELRDARACAVADFSVRYDGRINGVALGSNGQPAAEVPIEIMAVESVEAKAPFETIRAKTDAGGYFELTEVPPGRYLLGVGLRRTAHDDVVHPRTFYPGTPDAHDATVITVGEGNHQRLEPFRLPPARQRRELTGVVLWPDGRPIGHAFVSLWDGEASWRQVAGGIATDVDGRFSFVVHDGLSYTVHASANIPDDPKRRSAAINIGPFVMSEAIGPVRMVLTPPRDR